MSERSGWDVLHVFLLTGGLVLLAAGFAEENPVVPVSSSSFVHSGPVIYVADSSGARWPVGSATRDWSRRSGNVTLRYGSCRTNYPCITVSDERAPSRAAAGRTQRAKPSSTGETRVSVTLNNSASLSASRRRSIVCRELGRALGLPYRDSTSSCMSRSGKASSTPDKQDVRALSRRY